MSRGLYRLASPGLIALLLAALPAAAQEYPVVDTGQTVCYDDSGNAMDPEPASGESFYGQDDQNNGYQPSYAISEEA